MIQRLTAMMLSVIMVVGMMPVLVAAKAGGLSIGASGEITVFEALRGELASQSVPLGTSKTDLELPDTLTATLRLTVLGEESVLDSGEADSDNADTISGSAIGIDEMDGTETGEESEITLPLPVTWTSSPEYNGEAAGTYHFTPKLLEGFTLASGVEVPTIVVTVNAAVITGTVTAFDELPDDIRWQNTTAPEFPEMVDGTVAGKTAQIPVTWEADHDYDADYPLRGLYVFTAVLGKGYGLADSIELPHITVYIPQTVGGRMARTAGGGTTDSPLEITTAAQLAEISTLVNARENGLELFLFNDADAQVTLEMQNDIDLSAYSDGEGWTPIGAVDNPFTGIFDGNDKSIIGLYINRNVDYQGLFGYVGNEGTVKNLGMANVNITGHINVGSVAGWVRGTLQNCYNTGSVTGSSYVGGVAGEVDRGTLENCYNTGSVTSTGSGTSGSAGGVAGWVSGTVQNCYNTGNVTGTGVGVSTGGIAGWVTNTGIVQNCYNTGSITASGTGTGVHKICAGGVAGWVYGTVQNCYNTGSITGTGTATSAYVGGVTGAVYGTVQSCAALNSSISTVGYNKGRVAGIDTRNRLSGNIAYSGMTVNGGTVSSTDTDSIDGVDMDASVIQTLWTIGALSDWNSSAWTLAEGKLPVLAGLSSQSDALPAYIIGLAGMGSMDDPYRIYTAADLKYMADMVNSVGDFAYGKFFRLEDDIDLSAYGKDYDDGKGWTPIGRNGFVNAVFDGNGKTITGLYINRSNETNIGLFGQVTSGTIRNLFLEGIALRGDTDFSEGIIGGLAGRVIGASSISGCAATGSVSGEGAIITYCAGGLVGFLEQGSTLNHCAFYGTVSAEVEDDPEPPASSPSAFAGGIAGRVYNGAAVTNCVSVADVSATGENAYAGSIAGQVDGGAKIVQSAALGAQVFADTTPGRIGVIGFDASGDPANKNYAWSGMKVNGSTVSGTANNLNGADTSTAAIQTLWTTGSLNTWDSDVWTLAEGKLPVLAGLSGQSDALPSHISGSYFKGSGTSEIDPYLIQTAADLARLVQVVNAEISPYANSGRYYKLMNDIDLSDYAAGEGWTPIGTNMTYPFKGSFDGNNKSITGLTINRPEVGNIGLFGYLYLGSKVQNLSIMGASVTGKDHVGGVSGFAWGATVENCAISGSISGTDRVGGVAGFASSGTVQNCYSTGNVTGTGDYVGGVVGYLEYNTTTVQSCYSAARVAGKNSIGGVAGEVGAGSVQNCYSTGSVTGTGRAGGVAGNVGGGTVENCYSTGSVTGTNSYVGGVVGFASSGTVKNCVALNPSIVGGTYNFGRVVGNNPSGTILNNYAFSCIPGTWSNKGPGAKDGADVTSQTLFSGNFWTMTTYWDIAAWDGMTWICVVDKLPMLAGPWLAEQRGDSGLYLTARDIQYAKVGTVGFTYNGSEQVPTITFDSETLTKDTDYTVSITSTDSNDTSAGTNAGEVTLTITGIGSFYGTKIFTYTIDKKAVTITPPSGQSKKYGAADPVLAYTASPTLSGGDVFTGSLSRAAGENTGNYAIALGNLSAGGNYELSLDSGTVNFTIEQAKVESISTTVSNVNKTAYEAHNATTAQAVVDSVGLPSSVNATTDGGTATLPITWGTSTMYNAQGAEYAVIGTLTGNSNVDTNGVTKSVTITVVPVTAVNPTFSDMLAVINIDTSTTGDELGGAILPPSGGITIEGVSVAYTINWNGGETLDRTAVGNEQTFTGTISYVAPPAWLTLPSDFTVSRKVTVTEQTYTIIFNLNGGSRTGGGGLTQTVAEDSAATAPTVSRISYTFTGWNKSFDKVTADLTVTANWSYNGGGGSSGGCGSYTPNTPATTTPAKKPDQPVKAVAYVTATAGANGTASANISDKAITDAITKVQGRTANGVAVELAVTMPQGATSFTATMSRNSLNSLVSAGVSSLTLAGSPVDVSFDLKALQEIQKQSNGTVTISITPVRNLSTGAQTVIGGRPVYEITVSYVKDGKAVTVSAFSGGIATISIPYAPGRNETAGYLYGVYVDAKGNPQRIDGSAYDANAGAILISTEHLSVYGVGYTTPSVEFTDISAHWAKESIDYVVGRGLLTGTTKATFAPNNAMTRRMLVTALGRLAGVDTKLYTTNSFTDVKADSTFRPYIEWAYKKGVVQGIGNQQFAPDRAITREEIAVIFTNYAKSTGYKQPVTREATTYADAFRIGTAYKTAVTAMQQAGIMVGGNGNKFNPKANVTRAEVSSMLHRYIKLTIDPATAQGWALNDAGQYLYYKDGKTLTGTQTIDGMKYFFETTGVLKTSWVKGGDNWRYYFGNIATVGWLDISDKRYYFTKDGLMVSGKWLELDSKWCYFYADGSLAKNAKVDGYEVDENGVRKTK